MPSAVPGIPLLTLPPYGPSSCNCALQARLGEVEARIASLEAELATLRDEAAELRERRASSAQHHKARLSGIRSGKPAASASPAEIAAALQGGLGALEGLSGAVRGGGLPAGAAPASDAAALAAEVVAAEVPVKLLGAMQQVRGAAGSTGCAWAGGYGGRVHPGRNASSTPQLPSCSSRGERPACRAPVKRCPRCRVPSAT